MALPHLCTREVQKLPSARQVLDRIYDVMRQRGNPKRAGARSVAVRTTGIEGLELHLIGVEGAGTGFLPCRDFGDALRDYAIYISDPELQVSPHPPS